MHKRFLLGALLAGLLVLGLVPALSSTPVSAQGSPACPGAPTPRLEIGQPARVAQTYSTLWVNPTSSAVYTVMTSANRDTFTVVDGPFCSVGPYNWWQVTFNGITGWVTEGTGNAYWVAPGEYPATPTATPVTPEPPTTDPNVPQLPPRAPVGQGCPGAPTPRLSIDAFGQPAQSYQSLWLNPYSTQVLLLMYRNLGDTYEVLDGPFCWGPYNWWYVEHEGVLGFITEGTGGAYWAEPIGGMTSPETTPEAPSS